MSRAICFSEYGGPEVLQLTDLPVPEPGPGEVRIRQRAIGVNFIDIYQRSGLYKVPLPAVAGNEAAGEVEAVGPGVTTLAVGDRVAYAGYPGAYCESRVMPAGRLCRLPDGVSFEQAAGMMLKGLTVQYLIRQIYPVREGETVLFHAAAGGVGSIACQWLKALGVRVIGTAGSEEKCREALRHGATHCINYKTEDIVAGVREITGGEMVPVVFDSVGKATFDASLHSLRPRGHLISFGNASGPVPPFEIGILAQLGSLSITRPSLMTFIARPKDLAAMAADLFDVVSSGAVRIEINRRYRLEDAARAHRELEGRTTTGTGIILPD